MSSFIMLIFKVIPYLWPFIKEMLIGKKTWRQAFRENRAKTIITVSLTISLVFNVVLVSKVGHLAVNYLALSRAKQELEHKYTALKNSKPALVSTPRQTQHSNVEVVAPVARSVKDKPRKTPRKAPLTAEEIRAAELRLEADRIQQREAVEH